MVRKEPTIAPQMPACSGSRESPVEKKPVLKRDFDPAGRRHPVVPAQLQVFSLLRADSGKSRRIAPLVSWSISDDDLTQIEIFLPIRSGFAITWRCSVHSASVLKHGDQQVLPPRVPSVSKSATSVFDQRAAEIAVVAQGLRVGPAVGRNQLRVQDHIDLNPGLREGRINRFDTMVPTRNSSIRMASTIATMP